MDCNLRSCDVYCDWIDNSESIVDFVSSLKLLAGSSPAAFNDETLDSLNSLHLPEDFTINHIVSDTERDFFTANPITCDELSVAIKGLPSGRSAGPSGLSYDHLIRQHMSRNRG
ncbi:hypothetical protein P9112_012195 [Eukaryota sp. TZLM1-RC]